MSKHCEGCTHLFFSLVARRHLCLIGRTPEFDGYGCPAYRSDQTDPEPREVWSDDVRAAYLQQSDEG